MRTIIVLSLLCTITLLPAQAPTCEWVLGAGGTTNAQGTKVAVDALGNVYQTGFYSSPNITFGDSTLEHALPPNTDRIFLAKYDPQGQLLWARQPAAYESGQGLAVAADADGNVIIGGYFEGDHITFGNVLLYGSSVDNDLFVAKYDADGEALWGLTAGGTLGTAPEFVTDVCTDAAGNVFFTGYSSSEELMIGSTALSNPGPNQSFIVKMDPLGSVLWVRGCYGTCTHQSTTLTTDAAGNAYLGGWFYNSPLSYGGVATSTASGFDGYLFKFDPDGWVLWAKNVSGTNDEQVKDLCFSSTGQLMAVGTARSPLVHFGALAVPSTGAYYSSFIARYDTAGTAQWARIYSDSTMVWDVACDDLGNSYLTGAFQSDAMPVGNDTLVNTGTYNGYVLAHDAAGLPLWSARIGGSWVGASGIATDGAGSVYVSGYFTSGPLQCDTINVAQAVAGTIGNVFLVKLHAPEISTTVPEAPLTVSALYPNPCAGTLYLDPVPNTPTTFTVLDPLGRVVLAGRVQSGQVDVGSLGAGMYILRIVAHERMWSIPFVRE